MNSFSTPPTSGNSSESERNHPPGRIAGIDYGTVRIGVALSDSNQTVATPWENYTRRGEKADAEFFCRLVREERVARFVVGLPVHSGGEESGKSLEARRFGEWLGQLTSIPVEYYDERFTSQQAEQILGSAGLSSKQRKQRLDMLAAQILLASYLESHERGQAAPGALDD